MYNDNFLPCAPLRLDCRRASPPLVATVCASERKADALTLRDYCRRRDFNNATIDGALVYKGKGKKVDVPNSGVYLVGIRGVIVKWRFGKACFYISEKGASVRWGLCLVDACTFCFFAVLS